MLARVRNNVAGIDRAWICITARDAVCAAICIRIEYASMLRHVAYGFVAPVVVQTIGIGIAAPVTKRVFTDALDAIARVFRALYAVVALGALIAALCRRRDRLAHANVARTDDLSAGDYRSAERTIIIIVKYAAQYWIARGILTCDVWVGASNLVSICAESISAFSNRTRVIWKSA